VKYQCLEATIANKMISDTL